MTDHQQSDSGPDLSSQNDAAASSPCTSFHSPLPSTPSPPAFAPLVTVVGFHHARGPEVESWFGVEDDFDPTAEYGWSLLPFMALSDGAHATEEEFSYFTLLRPKTDDAPATSLFGISCTRQMDSSQLLRRPSDVTRSTVQKAVVVIAESPQFFGLLRQRLSIVTQAWFAQRDFSDTEILRRFHESLAADQARGPVDDESGRNQHLGMSLRELVHEFRSQTLVLFKCCLLQPKMLFFGSRCDRLCMVQYSLISLIPGLLRSLQDCADPDLNNYEEQLSQPTSLQSSNRSSLLSFMGLPLQIFGKGSFFGPYTPLQQLDILADSGTKSYLVGSTNSLLLQQKDRYSDVVVNLDDNTVTITSPALKSALALTTADRRWIDFLTQEINHTWDEANPSRPKTLQYVGSEEFIRSQFEAYLLGLIASVKFHLYAAPAVPASDSPLRNAAEEDPALDFGLDWVEAWQRTENFRIWDTHTDANLFVVTEPRHPSAGGLTMDDIQRRIADQVKDLHLDERLAQGRDLLERNLVAGREKASTVLSKLYADVEYLRESQRRRAPDPTKSSAAAASSSSSDKSSSPASYPVDLARAQQAVQSAGLKASAYVSSWAAWAGEKRRGSAWGSGWTRRPRSDKSGSPLGATTPPHVDARHRPFSLSASTEGGRSSSTTLRTLGPDGSRLPRSASVPLAVRPPVEPRSSVPAAAAAEDKMPPSPSPPPPHPPAPPVASPDKALATPESPTPPTTRLQPRPPTINAPNQNPVEHTPAADDTLRIAPFGSNPLHRA